MKKIILFFICAASAGAFQTDWGGTFQSYLDYSNVPGRELTVGLRSGLWSETDFGSAVRLNFSGGYGAQFDKGELFHFPELYSLSVFVKMNRMSYRIGRLTLADQQKRLYSALLDGVEITWNGAQYSHQFGGGFTGFVFNRTSQVIMTAQDQRNFDSASVLSLASPRVAAAYEITRYFETGSGRKDPKSHELSTALLAEYELRDPDRLIQDDPDSSLLHSGFVRVGLKGRLTRTVDYNIGGVFQGGLNEIPNEDKTLTLMGALGEAELTWSPGGSWKPQFRMSALYTTGDQWNRRSDWEGTQFGGTGQLHQYTPFTTRTVGYVYGSRVGNLAYGHLGLSFRPYDSFSLRIEDYAYIRPVNGPVSELPIKADSGSDQYLGNEVVVTADFRIFSDLGLQLLGGLYMLNDQLMKDQDPFQYRVGAVLSMSY